MLLDGREYADDASVTVDITPRGYRRGGIDRDHAIDREMAALAAVRRAFPVHDYATGPHEMVVRVSVLDDDTRTLADLRRDIRAKVRAVAQRAYDHPDAPVVVEHGDSVPTPVPVENRPTTTNGAAV